MAICSLLAAMLTGMIRLRTKASAKETASLRDLFAGVKFVRDNPAMIPAAINEVMVRPTAQVF